MFISVITVVYATGSRCCRTSWTSRTVAPFRSQTTFMMASSRAVRGGFGLGMGVVLSTKELVVNGGQGLKPLTPPNLAPASHVVRNVRFQDLSPQKKGGASERAALLGAGRLEDRGARPRAACCSSSDPGSG